MLLSGTDGARERDRGVARGRRSGFRRSRRPDGALDVARPRSGRGRQSRPNVGRAPSPQTTRSDATFDVRRRRCRAQAGRGARLGVPACHEDGRSRRGKRTISDIGALVLRLHRRLPGYWVAVFEHLQARLAQLGLSHVAAELLHRGATIINNRSSISDLAQVCFDLAQLLPAAEKRLGDQLPGGIVSHVK